MTDSRKGLVRKVYFDDKVCENCGKNFNRGTMPSGRMEAGKTFILRRYCSNKCASECNHQPMELPDKKCPACGKIFNRRIFPSGQLERTNEYLKRKYCSKRCFYNFHSGENHGRYKVGRWTTPAGYVMLSDFTLLHRVIMSQVIGRKLRRDEFVHHIDEDKSNNNPNNLQIMSPSEHARHHALTRERNESGKFA